MTVTVFTPEPLGCDRPKDVRDMASDITDAGYTFHRIAGASSFVIFEVHDADGIAVEAEMGKLDHNEHDLLDRLVRGFHPMVQP